MKHQKIKATSLKEIPQDYTGIVEWSSRETIWYKKCKTHREDGPAYTRSNDSFKQWWLDGELIWHSNRTPLDLTNKIVLSKTKHPLYPTIQVWKILEKDKVWEQIVIPGMEKFITE